jgi:hypothetical protein
VGSVAPRSLDSHRPTCVAECGCVLINPATWIGGTRSCRIIKAGIVRSGTGPAPVSSQRRGPYFGSRVTDETDLALLRDLAFLRGSRGRHRADHPGDSARGCACPGFVDPGNSGLHAAVDPAISRSTAGAAESLATWGLTLSQPEFEQLVHDHGRLLLDNAGLERRLAKALADRNEVRGQLVEIGLKLGEVVERLRQIVMR